MVKVRVQIRVKTSPPQAPEYYHIRFSCLLHHASARRPAANNAARAARWTASAAAEIAGWVIVGQNKGKIKVQIQVKIKVQTNVK